MNELCAAKTTKDPTIDESLNKLLDLVHATEDKADSIFGKLFRDCEPPCETAQSNPVNCVESKIRLAIEKADITLKTLTAIQQQL